jgi:putative Holliday junction resolvase
MIMDIEHFDLTGKRIVGIDYGLKRVGLAVCDELHITVSPKMTFLRQQKDFWEAIIKVINYERAGAIVVGVPYGFDESKANISKDVFKFIEDLKKRTDLKIIPYDESFSSYEAMDTMLSIGKKKKKRAAKETKDMIAAAVILRNFLREEERRI